MTIKTAEWWGQRKEFGGYEGPCVSGGWTQHTCGNSEKKWNTRTSCLSVAESIYSVQQKLGSSQSQTKYTIPQELNIIIQFYVIWLCISIYVCNKTNLMHYLSSDYWVAIILHVLVLLDDHHQEVTMYNIYVSIGTLLPPDDGKLASPKHVEL
jgi:hypothetical protein